MNRSHLLMRNLRSAHLLTRRVRNLASEVKKELSKPTARSKKAVRAHRGEANRPNPENESVVALTSNLASDVFSGIRETTLNDQTTGRTSTLAVWSDTMYSGQDRGYFDESPR